MEQSSVCDICGKEFSQDVKSYRMTNDAEVLDLCGMCYKEHAQTSELSLQRPAVDIKSHVCETCHKSFKRKSDLLMHQRYDIMKKDRRLFDCSVCGKTFERNRDLWDHHNTHTGETPHACETCGQCFQMRVLLRQHQRCAHKSDTQTFNCWKCSASFGEKGQLLSHKQIAHGEQPKTCSSCGKHFSSRRKLLGHQRGMHTPGKGYVCEYCCKSFTRKTGLQRHVNIHTNGKPHGCTECGRSFVQKRTLTNHLLSCHKQDEDERKDEHLCNE